MLAPPTPFTLWVKQYKIVTCSFYHKECFFLNIIYWTAFKLIWPWHFWPSVQQNPHENSKPEGGSHLKEKQQKFGNLLSETNSGLIKATQSPAGTINCFQITPMVQHNGIIINRNGEYLVDLWNFNLAFKRGD